MPAEPTKPRWLQTFLVTQRVASWQQLQLQLATQTAALSPGKRPRHTTRYSPCQRTTSSTNARKVREPPSGQRSRGILNTSQPADDLFSIAFPGSCSPPDKQTSAIIGPCSSSLSSTFTGTLTATNPALSEASAQTRSKDSETLGSPPWLIFIVLSGMFKRGHLTFQRERSPPMVSHAAALRRLRWDCLRTRPKVARTRPPGRLSVDHADHVDDVDNDGCSAARGPACRLDYVAAPIEWLGPAGFVVP